MRISRRQSIGIAIGSLVLFFAGGILFVPASKRQSEHTTAAIPAVETPLAIPTQESRFTLQEFHRSEMKAGKKSWEIFGTQGQFYPQENAVKVFSPKVLLYKPNGDIVELKAREAMVYLSGASVERALLEHEVLIVYNDKTSLRAESLNYNRTTNSVEVPGAVVISGEILEVRGEDLSGNLEAKEFILKRNVTSTLKPKIST